MLIKSIQIFSLLLFVLMFSSCSSGPEAINYGKENCAYCKMLIMDQRFGAETVTKKGKIYKFDAIECMLNYVKTSNLAENDIANYYVADASENNKLIPVTEAGFMYSEKLPSPMGSNISAFTKGEAYQKALHEFLGQPLNWEEVNEKILKK